MIAAALCGCAASGAKFEETAPASGKAAIYVYSLDKTWDTSLSPEVMLDDVAVGRLKPRGHIRMPVAPGPHTVQTMGSIIVLPLARKKVEIDAKPGENYYLRLDAFRGYVLTRMPADLAAQEIVMTRAND